MTRLYSIFIGLALSAALFALMVASRLYRPETQAPELLAVKPIELIDVEDPPPPPPPPIQEEADDAPPPPAPSVQNLPESIDPDTPRLLSSPFPVPLNLPTDPLSPEVNVSDLPSPPVIVKPVKQPIVKTPTRPQAKPAPPAPRTNPPKEVSISQLDAKPRLLHNPRVTFPRALQAQGVKQGTATVDIVILPSGRSQLRRVISCSHPELEAAARTIANGSRFTPPTRQGQPVTATMRWPLIIK